MGKKRKQNGSSSNNGYEDISLLLRQNSEVANESGHESEENDEDDDNPISNSISIITSQNSSSNDSSRPRMQPTTNKTTPQMVGLPFFQVGHPSRNIESSGYTLSLSGNSRSVSSISTAGINTVSSQHSRSGITRMNRIKEEIIRFLSITPHDSALLIRYNSASQM